MMNLAVGIAESHAESVPVLALVGQPALPGEGRGAFQDSSGIGRAVNAVAFFRGIAKVANKIAEAKEFWPTFERAVVDAQRGRPGPAVLLVPRSLWTAEVAPMPSDFAELVQAAIRPIPLDRLGPADPASAWTLQHLGDGLLSEGKPVEIRLRPGGRADPAAVGRGLRALLDGLRSAHHPVLIVGQGVRRCSNPAAVIDFARAVRLPMMTDLSARAEVPNDDPLYLGMLGVAGHPSAHGYLRDRVDLLFVVGTGLNAMTRGPLSGDPVDIMPKQIVAVNIDMGELSRVVKPPGETDRSWWPKTAKTLQVAIEADAGVVFEELLRLWRQDPFEIPPAGTCRFERFRPSLAPPLPPAPLPLQGTLLQSEALEVLQKALPRGGHLVYDAGNCAAAALHQFYVPPRTTATIALGMGGMGYALAAAVGIAAGSTREQRTLVFSGDGSFLMSGFEIHTAVDLGLPVLFVVFNNAMHGMCVTRQQTYFEGRLECVRYAPVDVTAVARGLGGPERLWVGRARTKEELGAALAEYAAHAARPGVLELVLAREEIPPFTPLLPKGTPRIEDLPPTWEWD
jgi:acetolactate synthase-1/2/3 large subunit